MLFSKCIIEYGTNMWKNETYQDNMSPFKIQYFPTRNCCPAAKHEGSCVLDQTYNGDWMWPGYISEWWDILLNKMILPKEQHENFVSAPYQLSELLWGFMNAQYNIQCGNFHLPRSTVEHGKQQLRVLRCMLHKSRHSLLILWPKSYKRPLALISA